MKKLLTLTSFALFLWIVALMSCQKELKCFDCDPLQLPVANAGADQTITLPKDSVILDGSASEPVGKITAWSWTNISAPASSTISHPNKAITIVKNLKAGIYQYELKVTDDKGLSAKDTVRVIVDDPAINQPPVACAGSDQKIILPNVLNLDATCSSDPDNNITGYNWSKISGPASFSITNAVAAKTTVTGLTQGAYQFELKVTDAGGLSSKDTVQITVANDTLAGCDLTGRPVIYATIKEIGKLSEPRVPAVGTAGNKLVYAGGWNGVYCQIYYYKSSSAVDIYDRTSQTWTTARLSKSRGDIAVATVGNKIFFAGGVNWDNYQSEQWDGSCDEVDIYDASNNAWSVAHLSKARESIAAVVIGNKVIFAGGTYFTKRPSVPIPVGNASDVVDIYDASTDSWSVAKLSVPRTYISAVTIGTDVYFAGGSGYGNTQNLNVVDVFNGNSNTWSTSTLAADVALNQSYQTNNYITWSKNDQATIKNINTGAVTSNCISGYLLGAPVMKNDVIVLPTGNNANGTLTQFDLYNVNTATWSLLKLNQSIAGSVNASMINVSNTVYLAGGYQTNGGCDVPFYDKVYALNW
jgi:hypothetical protein